MKMFSRFIVLSGLMSILLAGTAQASVITTTVTFTNTQSASGSGTIIHAGSSGLSGNFSPFNAALGTLDSYLIDWEVAITASGTPILLGGSFGETLGGGVYVNSINYNGGGNSTSAGSGNNTPIPAKTLNLSVVQDFPVATANPAISSAVTGGSDFSLTYKTGGNTAYSSYTNMADFTSTLTGSASITYNYTPSVPEPSTYLLLTISLGAVGYARKRMNKKSVSLVR